LREGFGVKFERLGKFNDGFRMSGDGGVNTSIPYDNPSTYASKTLIQRLK
jgi:hypothetical protein